MYFVLVFLVCKVSLGMEVLSDLDFDMLDVLAMDFDMLDVLAN